MREEKSLPVMDTNQLRDISAAECAGSRTEDTALWNQARAALAVPAGAILAVVIFALLLGLGYLVAAIAFSGAPPSALARGSLLWSGPVAILSAAVGGYLAARLAGGAMRRLVTAGGLSALGAVLLVIALIAGIAGSAFDFHSASIALGITEPARLPEEAVPTAVARSLPSDAPLIEPSDLAWRRTIKAVGWLASLCVLLIVAGALGGWVRVLEDPDPDAARNGSN
ncbi:MAG TPA: hypothetical protein VGR16_01230 [Thermomicrobiales bacterium]|nr:hypothetical protein [Thermomicrobiales bacterium]